MRQHSVTRRVLAVCAVAVSLALAGCSGAVTTPLARGNWSAPESSPLPHLADVVAIGDSIMKGHGLDPDDAWPAMLSAKHHWTLNNLSCDGAGFLTTGDESDCAVDFDGLVTQAIALDPSVVILSGSSNDFGEGNAPLLATTLASIERLHTALPQTRIVGLSTVWADTDPPDQLAQINTQVREAVTRVGGVYLDIGQPLLNHPEWMQSDDVHPTTDGQRALATSIDDAFEQAHLTLGAAQAAAR